MTLWDRIVLGISLVGAVGLGWSGLFGMDIWQIVFGSGLVRQIALAVIGLAGLWCVSLLFRIPKEEKSNLQPPR